MAIERRQFLGFDKPALHVAVDMLRRESRGDAGDWDLSHLTIVTPGSRAGRRLLECLVSAAEPAVLNPPHIVTPARLADELYTSDLPVASTFRCLLARMGSMQRIDRDLLERVVPHPPLADDHAGWYTLAEQFHQLAADIAAHRLSFADVPRLAAERGLDLRDTERWDALAAIDSAYHDTLAARGLVDSQHARSLAIDSGNMRSSGPIVLLAAPDLSDQLVAMLEQVDAPVHPLIHAEAHDAAGFTPLGRIISAYWQKKQIDLGNAALRFVESAADQARAVVQAIAQSPDFAPDQITVGLADESAAAAIERSLHFAHIPARGGSGERLADSRVGLFLSALSRFAVSADNPRFDDVAELLRHPDVQAAITSEPRASDAADASRWLTLLDRYATDHLQDRLYGDWLGDPDIRSRMAALYAAVHALLPQDAGDRRSLTQWSEPIAAACRAVFGHLSLDRQQRDDDQLIRSLEAVAEALTEQAEIDTADDLPPMTFSQAVALTLRRLAGAILPEPAGDSAVELVGFLELPLDDAPRLIVTSINDQFLPASRHADAWLPDHLRSALGMQDNAYRYARDLLLFSAAIQSRKAVTLIAPRRSAGGDPLAPSRLLLACDDDDLLARIDAFYRQTPAKVPGVLHAGTADRFIIPPPLRGQTLLTSLPVTAFRQYLACPYRFYLQYVLRLGAVNDVAVELDPPAFGNLVHEALRRFGESELRSDTNPRAIRDYLDDQVRRISDESFGKHQRTAVRIQIEQLRDRLHAFADQQARLAGEGWQIAYAERKLEAAIDVDGQPFTIRGRVDRIDTHPDHGIRIIDYKTADTAKKPEQTHRAPKGSQYAWADLQLPLYLDLIRSLDIKGSSALAYFNLPKKPEDTKVVAAKWSTEDLADAASLRDQIIRHVRARKFWPPGEPAAYTDAFSRICQDLAMNRESLTRLQAEVTSE